VSIEPFLVAGLLLALGIVAGCAVTAREQRRMLRELRKLAALYPPYPVSDDAPSTSNVFINEQWRDDQPGRD